MNYEKLKMKGYGEELREEKYNGKQQEKLYWLGHLTATNSK